jgi:quercetin dioxygenase-like cupin family protein
MEAGGESSRREFLELATLMAAGAAIGTGAVLGVGSLPVGATPPTGEIKRTPLAVGRLKDGISMATNGPSDFHIQRVVIEPGGGSGWHTHPGTALDVVTKGTVTAYVDGDDCDPIEFEAGQAFFVPPGVAHMARNEGSEPAEVYITYLVAAGAEPRTDAPKPDGCSA